MIKNIRNMQVFKKSQQEINEELKVKDYTLEQLENYKKYKLVMKAKKVIATILADKTVS